MVGWHAAFWLLLALSVLLLLLDPDVGPAERPVAVGVLALWGAAYLGFGVPAARGRDQRAARTYLVVAVLALPVLLWQVPVLFFLLFLAYPQVWFLLESRREAVGFTAAVAVSGALGYVLAAGPSPDVLAQGTASAAVSFLFSLGLGLWIGRIIEQSADRAALLVELQSARAELAAAERSAGASVERERMAREIHDTLAQGFTSVVMLAQVARRELGSGGGTSAARSRLDAIEDVARTNLAEARALVAATSPVDVHGGDLSAALQRLAQRFTTETGVRVDVRLADGAADGLGPERAVVLLRSAQEALSNVRRHAAAGHVVLTLDRDDGRVRLTVGDDGVGVPDTPGTGFGLDGVRRRALDVGGDAGVESGSERGTRLTVRVPAPGGPS